MGVSELKCESPSKKVQGVVVHVSPMSEGKTGSSYFHGKISDRVASMWFVGYDSKVRGWQIEYQGDESAGQCLNAK